MINIWTMIKDAVAEEDVKIFNSLQMQGDFF